MYFLIYGLLQLVTKISNSDGMPTIYLPLGFIVIVTAIKDFYEDYKRKISDNEENDSEVEILTSIGDSNKFSF